MPIRDRLRRAFRRSEATSSHSSYKPGEPLPWPKYAAAADREHTALLHAFSFHGPLEAARRRSGVSQYSPHGSGRAARTATATAWRWRGRRRRATRAPTTTRCAASISIASAP
jgi:hypothetical protein